MGDPLIADFRDMNKAIHSWSHLNKGAKIGQTGDLSPDDLALLECDTPFPTESGSKTFIDRAIL